MRFSIRDLASRAMVSKSSIVSLEQGKYCRPSTLAKVCTAMNLHVERLTSTSRPDDVPQNRVQVGADEPWFSLDNFLSGKIGQVPQTEPDHRVLSRMQMFRNIPASAGFIAGIIELTERSETRSHAGAEFVYLLRGRGVVHVGDQEFTLEMGDSITILDFEDHSYGPAPGQESPVSFLCFRLG